MRTATEFPSDGRVLRGWLSTPTDGDGPHPIVVLSHGWGATLRMAWATPGASGTGPWGSRTAPLVTRTGTPSG
jgi:predicted dienelactone hydrolase